MRHTIILISAVALLATACGAGTDVSGSDGSTMEVGASPTAADGDESPAAEEPAATYDDPPTASDEPATANDEPVTATVELLPRCRDLEPVAPTDEQFGDTPVYVGNEQPTDEVHAWASTQPGYAELWIDRDHNGWVVVGFTEGVDAARAEVADRWPAEGVVVVEVERGLDELLTLQGEVHERSPLVEGSSANVRRGRVELHVPVLTDEVHTELTAEFSGEPVCVDGRDPADAPAPGRQPTAGDGWRLLAAEQGTPSYAYMTGVATTPAQVATALATVELAGGDVDVDLETEVLVWFGEPHGSACPQRRLDDVTLPTDDEPVLRPVIVDPSGPLACTDDLTGAWAFVVAVDRSSLPDGPFTIRLTDRTPPIGDEATYVDADLSRPGATADDSDIRAPDPDPKDHARRDGDIVETGFPGPYVLDARCGVGALGTLNSVFWVSQDESLHAGRVPAPWQGLVDDDDDLLVEVLVEPGDPPTATATANGHSVAYVPGDPAAHRCD